jgi:hypothetical protein
MKPIIRQISNQWRSKFPEYGPSAHDLKHVYKDRWVRFYGLDEAKRYPESSTELEEVLHRHYSLLTGLGAKDEELFVITCDWGEFPVANINMSQNQLEQYAATYWKSVRDESAYAHFFVSRHKVGDKIFEEILKSIIEDQVGGVIIAPHNLRWLYHPYDGGVDVILESAAEKEELKDSFSDWAAPGPDGL